MKKILLIMFCFFSLLLSNHESSKIVGLLQIRNEENFIAQCIYCLAPYVDAMVILDDGSIDETIIQISKTIENLHPMEIKIICNKFSMWEQGNESQNRQRLLEEGRAIGGTHFVIVDTDEIFTANCLKDNYLRNRILEMQPGDSYDIWFICLWRNVDNYRTDVQSVWVGRNATFAFCDDMQCSYSNYFLHGPRIPKNLKGRKKIINKNYGLMHFQFVNWDNLLIKQAWYRCLEQKLH